MYIVFNTYSFKTFIIQTFFYISINSQENSIVSIDFFSLPIHCIASYLFKDEKRSDIYFSCIYFEQKNRNT